jgi:hypothetical protein
MGEDGHSSPIFLGEGCFHARARKRLGRPVSEDEPASPDLTVQYAVQRRLGIVAPTGSRKQDGGPFPPHNLPNIQR